jgi:hypothetical protein
MGCHATRSIIWSSLAIWLLMGSVVTAQTSTSLIKSAPRIQYRAAKEAMELIYNRFERNKNPDKNLFQCTLAGGYLGGLIFSDYWAEHDKLTVAIADLAYNVVLWSETLPRLGYPGSIWRESISSYESEGLRHLTRPPTDPERDYRDRAFLKKLAALLDAYRSDHPASLQVNVGGECGADEIEVSIVTQPSGGQVLFTPSFYYELCRAQDIDPEDTRQCNRWREAHDGKLEYVSGAYHYLARWSDGATRSGMIGFTANDGGKTITIRKP